MTSMKIKNKAAEQLVEVLDSRFFKSLSEPVRIELLKFLLINGTSDIGTIADHLPQDRSVISRHLNNMLEAGLVICNKEGRFRFYEVNSSAFLERVEEIVGQIRECMNTCCPDCCKN